MLNRVKAGPRPFTVYNSSLPHIDSKHHAAGWSEVYVISIMWWP